MSKRSEAQATPIDDGNRQDNAQNTSHLGRYSAYNQCDSHPPVKNSGQKRRVCRI